MFLIVGFETKMKQFNPDIHESLNKKDSKTPDRTSKMCFWATFVKKFNETNKKMIAINTSLFP